VFTSYVFFPFYTIFFPISNPFIKPLILGGVPDKNEEDLQTHQRGTLLCLVGANSSVTLHVLMFTLFLVPTLNLFPSSDIIKTGEVPFSSETHYSVGEFSAQSHPYD
jgi:hypothetical protein